MTRLLAFMLVCSACVVAVRSPESWQTIGALVSSGAVALMSRTKPKDIAS